jgi:hypothetical protein
MAPDHVIILQGKFRRLVHLDGKIVNHVGPQGPLMDAGAEAGATARLLVVIEEPDEVEAGKWPEQKLYFFYK